MKDSGIIRWLIVTLMLACIAVIISWPAPRPKVVRYRCIITPHPGEEILCFQPDDGRMFRPERRFNEFVLEVPK